MSTLLVDTDVFSFLFKGHLLADACELTEVRAKDADAQFRRGPT